MAPAGLLIADRDWGTTAEVSRKVRDAEAIGWGLDGVKGNWSTMSQEPSRDSPAEMVGSGSRTRTTTRDEDEAAVHIH